MPRYDEILRLYGEHECGDDGYPEAWHTEIKHLVRRQAGNRCVRCGHPYQPGAGEWSRCDEQCTHAGPGRRLRMLWEETLTPLDADGLVRFAGIAATSPTIQELIRDNLQPDARWRILTVHHLDGVKANCMWWNLASLCQRDHLTIQGKVRMEQTYPLEHSEWMKPYAAGYYAWVYRGQYLTRSEVMDQLEELLALERLA